MTEILTARVKQLHVIGDSHALAFKHKSIHYPAHGIHVETRVCFVHGLVSLAKQGTNELNQNILDFLRAENFLVAEEAGALAPHNQRVGAQYATGHGFERPILLLFFGEIYLVRYLRELHQRKEAWTLDTVKEHFQMFAANYRQHVQNLSRAVDGQCFVHTLNPPSADDEVFKRRMTTSVMREIRAEIYRLFNEALQSAFPNQCIAASDLADDEGILKSAYEFDGIHADPVFAYDSLRTTVDHWLRNRHAEFSVRYHRWLETTGARALRNGKHSVFDCSHWLAPHAPALLRSIGPFSGPRCELPLLDWAHFPLVEEETAGMVEYAPISAPGLETLHNVLFSGELHESLRNLLGANFSVLNCRVAKISATLSAWRPEAITRPPGIYLSILQLAIMGQDEAPSYECSLTIIDEVAPADIQLIPGSKDRMLVELLLLTEPADVQPIVHCHPQYRWPVDPFLFKLPGEIFPTSERPRRFTRPTLDPGIRI